MAGIAVTRSDPGYIGGRGIPPLPLAREQMAGPRRDRHHRHLSCSLCVQVARVCLVFLPIYGCYILRKIFLPPKDTSLSYSPAKKMEAPHTAGAEDGKRWRWLYGIFWKKEKDGDGSIGYFGRWKKVKMGFQGQLQRYLRRYLFFFPSLTTSEAISKATKATT